VQWTVQLKSQPNIVGKSVASVRSPVSTLNTYLPTHLPPITHDSFVQAVVDEFASVYSSSDVALQALNIDEQSLSDAQRIKIDAGAQELKSWQWTFGQTPEFSNDIEGDLSFGSLVCRIILSFETICPESGH
jgi:lipoate-protein ligase A